VELTTVWFCLIALLWTGYLVLEGFDFGVGILLGVLARDDTERRVMINTIGPVWDGNEVWLIVAGGATFAAFPEWYATLFSGFYLPLLAILLALIVRGVFFEFRGKIDGVTWRARWDVAMMVGSFVPALLWGVSFANLVRGVPIDGARQYTGTLLTLLTPFALLGGLTTLCLFTLHGAVFLGLRTAGEIRERAISLAVRLSVPTLVVAASFAVWAQISYSRHAWTWVAVALVAVALLGTVQATRMRREGLAFLLTSVAVVAVTVLVFGGLFPTVMPSTTDAAYSLTVDNAASTPYTLRVMTWVAAVLTPFVLLYQSWSYWIFRRRIAVTDIPPHTGLPWRTPVPRTR
jgi:cytochrome d ubiquinol oxidase subunit II